MSSKKGEPVRYELPSNAMVLCGCLVLVGLATFTMGLNQDPKRIWFSFLVSFFFFMSVSIGGVFFTALQYATNAGWSVTIRRFSEALTKFLPIGAVAAVILLFGSHHLYEWLNPEVVNADPLLQKKAAYLNKTFFIIRMVLFFGIWIFFANRLVAHSVKQDETGDESLTHKCVPLSIAFLILFSLSYTFFSFDTLMSLDPHWYSTIFGIYCFSGLFQSTLAFIILFCIYFMKKGLLVGYVTEDHLHDLGKLLFAFTIFYAYIGFSQFMLIWYANLPEETIFYLHRSHGNWMAVSMSLLIFKFIVPFIALGPRGAKRNPKNLVAISILILVMQYVDVYWMVYPNLDSERTLFSFWEIGVFLGFLGLFLTSVLRFLGKTSLVPVRDPRLKESLHHRVGP